MPNPSSLTNQSEITLQIGSEKLGGWSGLQVIRAIDSGADAFSFSLPFDPTPENIARFRPFSAQIVRIYIDDTLLLTGYIELESFASSASERTLNIQGRSASGSMIDISAGPPFQYSGMTFNQISTRMYQEFDPTATVGVFFASPDTKPISEVSIDPGQTIYQVLSKLAAGHGLWGSPTTTGRVKYAKVSSAGIAVASLVEGTSPVRSVTTSHDLTKRFQRYLVIGTYEGTADAQAEVNDSETFGFAKRGRKIVSMDQQTTSMEQAAKFARSKALIDSYTCAVELDGWHNNGKLWEPGQIITLQAPGAFVLSPTRLMIQRVTLQIDESGGQITALDLAIPQAYETEDAPVKEAPYVARRGYSFGV